MEKAQRRVGVTLAGTRSFLDDHAEAVGVVLASPARRQLDNALRDLSVHALAQDTAVMSAAALTAKRAHITAELKGAFLKPITQFARTSARRVPEFAPLTKSTHRKHGRALVAAARAIAATAMPLADALTAATFPPDFLDQLCAWTDALNATLKAQMSTKEARIAATDGIATALSSGREAVGLLDPVVSRLLRSSELLTAWQTVKRVPRSTAVDAG
jgi:hypothetical protein